jgi:hypothetical protein
MASAVEKRFHSDFCTHVAPAGFDAERSEQFRNKEAATLEVRGNRLNNESTTITTVTTANVTSADVPCASLEDDRNLQTVNGQRQQDEVIFGLSCTIAVDAIFDKTSP